MNIGNAPGLYGPPDEDDRVSNRAEELATEWLQDSLRLAEAADHVMGWTSYAEHMPQSVAGAMLGHPGDQTVRDLAFMRELRGRVEERVREKAQEQAEKESANWPSWRDVQRNRLRTAA